MNFITGTIFGIIISTVGLVSVAKWVDRTVDTFRHDVVREVAK